MWPFLQAKEPDRRTWLDLFKSPYDPFVELVKQDGEELLLLKAVSLSAFPTSRETYDAAKLLVRQMNNVVVAMIGSSEVTVIGTCERIDGRLKRNIHFEAGSL